MQKNMTVGERNSSFLTRSFPVIKQHYEKLTKEIIKSSEKDIRKWNDVHFSISWDLLFTPIEKITWGAIRNIGKAPFYPQYPIGNFFVDFGNPVAKVAIECDGKEFHKDVKKDDRRDKILFDLGWIVYRISGSDISSDMDDDCHNRHYYLQTIEGLISAISIFHFNNAIFNGLSELHAAYECLESRCSPIDCIKRIQDKLFKIELTV